MHGSLKFFLGGTSYGATAMDLPPIFERLKLDVGYWKLLVNDFGRLWTTVQFGSRCSNECVQNAVSDIETPIQSETS